MRTISRMELISPTFDHLSGIDSNVTPLLNILFRFLCWQNMLDLLILGSVPVSKDFLLFEFLSSYLLLFFSDFLLSVYKISKPELSIFYMPRISGVTRVVPVFGTFSLPYP